MQLFLFNVYRFLFPHLSVTMGLCSMCLCSFFWGNKGEKIHQLFKMGQRILSGILDRATSGAGDVSVSCLPLFKKLLLFLWAPGQDPAYPN